MNQFFDIQRFCNLLKNNVLLNYKQYLTAISAVFFGTFVFTSMLLHDDTVEEVWIVTNIYSMSFMLCTFVFVLFAGLSFPAFSEKKKTANYLLLPASTFEKYAAEIFLRLIVLGGLFLLTFWISINLCVTVKEWTLHSKGIETNMELFSYSWLISNEITSYGVIKFIAIVLFAFVVRLFFKRFALVKTALIGIGINIIYSQLIIILALTEVYPATSNLKLFDYGKIILYSQGSMIIISLMLLFLGYYKLKHKQI